MYTRTLAELTRNDAAIAGGKGASLGEMVRAGIPVPSGFVLLAPAFSRFIEEAHLDTELHSVLDGVNHESYASVEVAADVLQSLILNASVPEAVAVELRAAHAALGARFVAVRSSSTEEDGASNAWAGQHETQLNVTEAMLLESVRHCWASMFTPRAVLYRYSAGRHGAPLAMAIVVQAMVASEESGVAFTVNPVNEDPNQAVIEAVVGLGDAIVSGEITPDHYVVERQPRGIVERHRSSQQRGLFRNDAGGSVWLPVPGERVGAQVLDDARILALVELCYRIEALFGFACDIEWAAVAGEFQILQSRPITTLHGDHR